MSGPGVPAAEEATARQPVALPPPDIRAWQRGNTGVPFVHQWHGAAPGRHVLITALVHGNEYCGAYALDLLLRRGVRPRRGSLTLCFANFEAFARFDFRDPLASRFVDEDFNRLWSKEILDGPRHSAELARARAIRPFVQAADLLLDLHSMLQPAPALALAGTTGKGLALARRLGTPRYIVMDEGHAAGPRLRDYAPFIDPACARNALLVECGQHWQQASVDTATEVALRFLLHAQTIDAADAAPHLDGRPLPPQRPIEVTGRYTIRSDRFAFVRRFTTLERVPKAGTVIAHDGDEPVRTPHDDCLMIMPALQCERGQTAVRFGRELM